MATYGSAPGVKAIVPAAAPVDFSSSTTPSSSQVAAWLAQGSSEINRYLSNAGYVVPGASTADVYASLTGLNDLFAAAYVLRAKAMNVVTGSNEDASENMLKEFYSRLKSLSEQDLTLLGLSQRASTSLKRRRFRTQQLRRVDGYSEWSTGEAAE
jgi:hypothetical protein